jgi:hypothetical protein
MHNQSNIDLERCLHNWATKQTPPTSARVELLTAAAKQKRWDFPFALYFDSIINAIRANRSLGMPINRQTRSGLILDSSLLITPIMRVI